MASQFLSECEAKTVQRVQCYSRFGKVRVSTQISHLQSVIWFHVEQLKEMEIVDKSILFQCVRLKRRTHPNYQVLGELVIDVALDDRL
jgi:hypothetical protein